MHVLTLPRVRRRHDGEDPDTWPPVTVPATESVEVNPIDHVDHVERVETAAATQRVTRRVDGVGLGSVAKLALVFYGCVFASLAGGVLLIWSAISAMGYVDRFEHFMRSIGFRGFAVSGNGIVLGLIGIAGALTLLATLLTLAVACAYNIVGHTGHGLVLKMSEPAARDARSTAPVETAGHYASVVSTTEDSGIEDTSAGDDAVDDDVEDDESHAA